MWIGFLYLIGFLCIEACVVTPIGWTSMQRTVKMDYLDSSIGDYYNLIFSQLVGFKHQVEYVQFPF